MRKLRENLSNRRGIPGPVYERTKRTLDMVAGAMGLLIFGPLILACGLWIKAQDGSPMFYWQWRVGHRGWLFRIHKLRTMKQDAERKSGAQFAACDDDRVLPGCRWMRKAHIDELPQLWNILIGDMSLVGPRPERPEIVEWLRPEIPGIDRRVEARPGLTGLAQIRNGYANDLAGNRRKIAYDLQYLRKRTLMGELRLIFATLPRFWDRSAV